jgi:hypothetical protein
VEGGKAKQSRGPWMWPLALVGVGLVLLLDNFLLLGDFELVNLWPLLLVVAGAQILLRGDLVPSWESRTFGITRGSVESATLEVSAGEIDVEARALQREGRLIAGQFASQSRPALNVTGTHAHVKMERAATPWLSFADWQIGLARDLPWQVLVSTYLGQVNLDLSNLVVQDAVVATGIGDIRLVCPFETFGPVHLRSALGNIHVVTPPGHRVRIHFEESRLFHIRADENRYEPYEGAYISRDARDDAPLVEIHVAGTFGDAYLA